MLALLVSCVVCEVFVNIDLVLVIVVVFVLLMVFIVFVVVVVFVVFVRFVVLFMLVALVVFTVFVMLWLLFSLLKSGFVVIVAVLVVRRGAFILVLDEPRDNGRSFSFSVTMMSSSPSLLSLSRFGIDMSSLLFDRFSKDTVRFLLRGVTHWSLSLDTSMIC